YVSSCLGAHRSERRHVVYVPDPHVRPGLRCPDLHEPARIDREIYRRRPVPAVPKGDHCWRNTKQLNELPPVNLDHAAPLSRTLAASTAAISEGKRQSARGVPVSSSISSRRCSAGLDCRANQAWT